MTEQVATFSTPRRFQPSPKSPATTLRVYVVGAAILIAVGYLIFMGTKSTSVYYLTVAELQAQGPSAQEIRVAGDVVGSSIDRSAASGLIRFSIQDGGGTLPVTYKGLVPDIFGPNINVVVEGRYTSAGVFEATTLLAKCPSKFQAAVPTPVQ